MYWYYQDEGQRVGPISDDDFKLLVMGGVIKSETPVWNENLTKWITYGQLQGDAAPISPEATPSPGGGIAPQAAPVEPGRAMAICGECGRSFPSQEMLRFGDKLVCAACKPVYVQKLREGIATGELEYAGFWIRVGAKLIDSLIIGIIDLVIMFIFGGFPSPATGNTFMAGSLIATLLQWGLAIAYPTYFVGKFAATPGKMACGLKVVRSDGSPVSYGRACGRMFAEMLSGLILGIGYLMVAFDDECRALHDRICDTRVIRK